MENKYYTPTIEEFHVGFEYYFRSAWQEGVSFTEVTIDGKDGYEPMIFDFNIYHPNKGESWKDVHQSMIDHDQIKVKYLDREDIESLGFKLDYYSDEYDRSLFKSKTGRTLSYGWSEKTLWIPNKGMEERGTFYGIIKNKSELKVLLKQLGMDGKE